jgi:hypothetical protein
MESHPRPLNQREKDYERNFNNEQKRKMVIGFLIGIILLCLSLSIIYITNAAIEENVNSNKGWVATCWPCCPSGFILFVLAVIRGRTRA